VPVPVAEPEERLRDPLHVVELGYGRDAAMREASRCLDCGVTPVFDGKRCVLCGGCADVCPTQCLKLVSLSVLVASGDLAAAIAAALGDGADRAENSAILKDEDRCIRCALCAHRCPVDAITMERVTCTTNLEDVMNTTPEQVPSRLDPEPVPRRDFLGIASLSKKFRVMLPDSLAAGEPYVPPGRSVALFRDDEGVFGKR
jgi:ferredoxin